MASKGYDATVISKSMKAVEDLGVDKEKTSKKTAKGGGDAMGSAASAATSSNATNNAAGNAADASNAPLTRPDQETLEGYTFTYETVNATATEAYADHYNAKTGENEKLEDVTVKDSKMNDKYKKGKYVTKAPVDKAPKAEPALEELVEMTDAGRKVSKMQGTIENPNVINSVINDNIFIDGKVHLDDVRQGNIGDCYFLAALLQVIQHDPQRILDIMKVSGSTVTTTLYRKEKLSWVQQDIAVQIGVFKQNGRLTSSHWRIAYDPKTSRWSSSIDGSALKITREDLYEAALWVQCIEQAYMIFSKNYGQYGKGNACNVDLKSTIDGGHAQECMYMFFGDKVQAPTVRRKTLNNGAEGVDSLADNMSVIYTLQSYAQAANDGQKDVYLMAGVSTDGAVENLTFYAKKALEEIKTINQTKKTPELEKAEKNIELIYSWISRYNDSPTTSGLREGQTNKYQTMVRDEIDKQTIELKNNAEFQALDNPIFKTMAESAGIVVMRVTGKQEANNNIFIYSGHAYSVSDVKLIGKDGKDLTNESNLDSAQIDANKSSVTLINPHAKTKASLNDKEERYNDGKFEISLESFMNNVGYIRTATVNK